MPIISCFCKKGGVGKTTFIGYLAHYYALQNKKVLVISADDQNSIFKMFGVQHYVTDNDDDFFEHLMVGEKQPQDITFEARINLYLMKTLNTDKLSTNLSLKWAQGKKLQSLILGFTRFFDYILIDFPPSGNRFNEILLDLSDFILLAVGLDALSLDGYLNTIQYFADSGINSDKIKYIIPIGYHPIKSAPNNCLKSLKKLAKEFTPNAIITEPVSNKSIIQNLQENGISVFDEGQIWENVPKNSRKFHENNAKKVRKELTEIYKSLNF